MTASLQSLKLELLKESAADHVGFWVILWHVRRLWPDVSPTETKDRVLRVISDLLEAGVVEAGFPTRDGERFEPWLMAASEALSRIEREWAGLNHDPVGGEVVWFRATAAGDRLLSDK